MRLKNTIGDVRIEVNTDRLDRRLERAQNALDQQVLGDMLPYTPFLQGAMRGATQVIEPGLIEIGVPYAHYQYMGDLYLTEDGRSYAEKGERKYATGRPLHYGESGTGDHWFDKAKKAHGDKWRELVKREVEKE